MEEHIVSRERVTNHGEVYTQKREVDAMLDLVKQETERIESRFLEPACGTGNFLSEIIRRKISIVEKRYKKSQLEFEKYSIIATSSIYGIDILHDNIEKCRERLLDIFLSIYRSLYNKNIKIECINTIKYIYNKNIIWGDALTLKTVGRNPEPIIFPEWSFVGENMVKRRDFSFHGLLEHESFKQLPMFSDLGENVFIPTPVKEYPLIHYLEIANVERYEL